MRFAWFVFSALVTLVDALVTGHIVFGGNDQWMLPARSAAVQSDPQTVITIVLFVAANLVVAVRQLVFAVRELDA